MPSQAGSQMAIDAHIRGWCRLEPALYSLHRHVLATIQIIGTCCTRCHSELSCYCSWCYLDGHKWQCHSSTRWWNPKGRLFPLFPCCRSQLASQVGSTFYWHGEDKAHNSGLFKAVSCYTVGSYILLGARGSTPLSQSSDLVSWTRQNDALTPISGTMISTSNIVERPKGDGIGNVSTEFVLNCCNCSHFQHQGMFFGFDLTLH